MPIHRLVLHAAFEPEQVETICRAFEQVLQQIGLTDRTDPVAEKAAQALIVFAQLGDLDPVRLRERTIEAIQEPISS